MKIPKLTPDAAMKVTMSSMCDLAMMRLVVNDAGVKRILSPAGLTHHTSIVLPVLELSLANTTSLMTNAACSGSTGTKSLSPFIAFANLL